ncbi:hypothetical protein KQI89_00165 [Clostridium sp. MSJ-4]|uniref:N-acetyltransferase domain-containing protein n=1 Tax=Clostridium simiarum TaxID=2841506 RepID=A0ABS6EWZ3_9CLOT|nr:hypothetical protein [Clostridium simiarum]MBU5590169.1 hypothetical protein [Clostridium simiarum]
MRVRNINYTEIDLYTNMLPYEGSRLKDILSSWLEKGITRLDWCFVIEDNNKFLGRIIYGVFDDDLDILNIDFIDAPKEAMEKLLCHSVKEMGLKGFSKIINHLYSDKNNFKEYKDILLKIGFKITQEKRSFTWTQNYIKESSKRLIFKSLEDTGQMEYIEAIKEVTEGTLDEDDLSSIKEIGYKKAAEKYFNELKDIDFNKKWWKLAYTGDNDLLGLVVPQRFNEDTGAINYIGVVPKRRGNGYINDLLIEGTRILSENNITKIIADIDVKNFPLEKALMDQGYKFDCEMLVMKLSL